MTVPGKPLLRQRSGIKGELEGIPEAGNGVHMALLLQEHCGGSLGHLPTQSSPQGDTELSVPPLDQGC